MLLICVRLKMNVTGVWSFLYPSHFFALHAEICKTEAILMQEKDVTVYMYNLYSPFRNRLS